MLRLLLLIPLLAPATARAADDAWLGRDKWLHFGASAALSAGGYGLGAALWEEPEARLAAGAAAGLGAGLAKEAYDLAGGGDPSWKDVAWDVAGTGVGLFLAWGLDRLTGGSETAELRGGALALRF